MAHRSMPEVGAPAFRKVGRDPTFAVRCSRGSKMAAPGGRPTGALVGVEVWCSCPPIRRALLREAWMISRRFNVVFVHIPKTAGQSIEAVFLHEHDLTWD